MTPGNNGTPEHGDDDPFGYLYRGEGEEPPPAVDRPGVPRTSYHQVTRVGERRQAPGGYGYPPQQPQYGQQQPQQPYAQQQQPYTQQQPQPYGSPEPSRGGHGGHSGGSHNGGGGRGAAPNRRGLMFGAVAVVLVVAVGIVIAVVTGNNKGDKQAGGGSATPTTGQSQAPTTTASADPNANLPQQYAATLTLTGGAETNNNHNGAKGPNGVFVDGMGTPGATATWTAQLPKAGTYTLWVRYANAQPDDAKTTVVVNGKPLAWKMNLKDYGTPGNWDDWFSSFVSVDLKQGANTIALSCGSGDVCHYNLDRVGLTTSQKVRPDGWS